MFQESNPTPYLVRAISLLLCQILSSRLDGKNTTKTLRIGRVAGEEQWFWSLTGYEVTFGHYFSKFCANVFSFSKCTLPCTPFCFCEGPRWVLTCRCLPALPFSYLISVVSSFSAFLSSIWWPRLVIEHPIRICDHNGKIETVALPTTVTSNNYHEIEADVEVSAYKVHSQCFSFIKRISLPSQVLVARFLIDGNTLLLP